MKARFQDQVLRALSLIKNVRKFAEIQVPDSKTFPVKICDVIRDTVAYVQKSYPSGKIKIETSLEGKDPITVEGNDYLGDVFENIISNSIKYNTSDVKLIHIDVTEESVADSNRVKVSISDKGVGMPEHMKSLIMDGKLKRGPNDSHRLGIGLSVVTQIINRVNGKLTIENRVYDDYTKGTIINVMFKKVK